MMFNYSSIADENSSHGDDCALLDLMMMIIMMMIMLVAIITSWTVINTLWMMIIMIMMTIITSWVVHFSSIVLIHGHSDGPPKPEHHVKPDNHDHPNLTKVILELWERFWLFLSSIATSSHILLLRQTTN